MEKLNRAGLGMIAAVVLCTGLAQAADAPGAGQLEAMKPIIGSGGGGWDYVTVDAEARRIYVAHSTKVVVFDADKGTLIGEVADMNGAHGTAIVPERGEGYATSGKDSSIHVFDLKTLKTTRVIPAGQKPDAVLYDPASKKVFAFNNASGDVTVVDPAAAEQAPTTLEVGGVLEFAVTDGAGRVFVNVEDKNEIAVIDTKTLKVTARWPIAPGARATGMAIDVAHHRLFAGCSNQKMIVLDTDSGKVIADVAIGSGVDGVAFDAQLGVALSANGKDGTATVVREGAGGKFEVAQTVTTAVGARTIADDPGTHRFYLPCMVPDETGKTAFGLVVIGVGEKK